MKRLLAISFSAVLFSTHVLWAHRAEVNIWEDTVRPYGNVRKILNPSFAKATEGKPQTIIHIQDIHQNPEAQRNIAQAIQTLVRNGNVDLVALEGAFAPIDLSVYRNFPYPKSVKAMADYLFKTNRITGPIHGLLTVPSAIPTVAGIDDKTHYDANVEAYRQSSSLMTARKRELAQAERALTEEKIQTFNPSLADFDGRVQSYRAGTMPWGAYVETLARSSAAVPSSVQPFLETLALESHLDFARVERERTALLARLGAKLNQEETARLMSASIAYRLGATAPSDFYRALRDLCQRHQVSLARYSAMDAYIRYVLLADALDVEKITSDAARMEEDAYAALAKTPDEKRLVARSKELHLTKKLVEFALTREEWKELKKFTIDDLRFSIFKKFYEEAETRDTKMATHLINEISSNHQSKLVNRKFIVLITGGFHSTGIDRRLADAGYMVVSFVPKLTKTDGENGSAYLSAFAQEKTPLDQLFAGEKLFLSTLAMPESPFVPQVLMASNVAATAGTAAAERAVVDGLATAIPAGTTFDVRPSADGSSSVIDVSATSPSHNTLTTPINSTTGDIVGDSVYQTTHPPFLWIQGLVGFLGGNDALAAVTVYSMAPDWLGNYKSYNGYREGQGINVLLNALVVTAQLQTRRRALLRPGNTQLKMLLACFLAVLVLGAGWLGFENFKYHYGDRFLTSKPVGEAVQPAIPAGPAKQADTGDKSKVVYSGKFQEIAALPGRWVDIRNIDLSGARPSDIVRLTVTLNPEAVSSNEIKSVRIVVYDPKKGAQLQLLTDDLREKSGVLLSALGPATAANFMRAGDQQLIFEIPASEIKTQTAVGKELNMSVALTPLSRFRRNENFADIRVEVAPAKKANAAPRAADVEKIVGGALIPMIFSVSMVSLPMRAFAPVVENAPATFQSAGFFAQAAMPNWMWFAGATEPQLLKQAFKARPDLWGQAHIAFLEKNWEKQDGSLERNPLGKSIPPARPALLDQIATEDPAAVLEAPASLGVRGERLREPAGHALKSQLGQTAIEILRKQDVDPRSATPQQWMNVLWRAYAQLNGPSVEQHTGYFAMALDAAEQAQWRRKTESMLAIRPSDMMIVIGSHDDWTAYQAVLNKNLLARVRFVSDSNFLHADGQPDFGDIVTTLMAKGITGATLVPTANFYLSPEFERQLQQNDRYRRFTVTPYDLFVQGLPGVALSLTISQDLQQLMHDLIYA